MITHQEGKPPDALLIEGLDTHNDLVEECQELVDDLIPISLEDGNNEHADQIGSNLDDVTKQHLVAFLHDNTNIFA